MTKRIVSGIFILTALGALGVILAGALTSGEQLIVRFLTAVIVAALGLYVISDLRLQADDDAATARASGSARLKTVDAPPNSTAAFMATVTKKTEVRADDGEEAKRQPEPAVLEAADATATTADTTLTTEPTLTAADATVTTTMDAGVFGELEVASVDKPQQELAGVGAGTEAMSAASASTISGEVAVGDSDLAMDGDVVTPEDLGLVKRRVVSSRPNGTDATVTDLFAGTTPSPIASLGTDNGSSDSSAGSVFGDASSDDTSSDSTDSEESNLDSTDLDESDLDDTAAALADVTADPGDADTGSVNGDRTNGHRAEDDADLTQLLQVGGMPAPLGIVSEFKSGEPSSAARSNPFQNGATSAKISFSSDPIGDNVSFSGPDSGLNGAAKDDTGKEDTTNDGDNPADGAIVADADLGDADGASSQNPATRDPVESIYEVHELGDLDQPATTGADGSGPASEQAADDGSHKGDEMEIAEPAAVVDFQYSDELDSPDQVWPAQPAKLNGSSRPHPFTRTGPVDDDETGLNGHRTTLPIPTPAVGLAADYVDAPLAPIIDLREVNGHNADNIDIAINAGELEVISTLIEQGMLSTDGPISDRDVRTMVYVAFTSNELRKLLLAGGTPDGPNHGLDLGPVELFDERIHAPAPKRLYSGMDHPEAQSQIG